MISMSDALRFRPRGSIPFPLIARRYERRSSVITSNLVFSEWGRSFKSPMTTAAAIDRLVHHAAFRRSTAARSGPRTPSVAARPGPRGRVDPDDGGDDARRGRSVRRPRGRPQQRRQRLRRRQLPGDDNYPTREAADRLMKDLVGDRQK
ncbi:MAG: ATP-binding protein [Deltaproteobacteria bacterium]|nr:ATP-binding protein [Deltaproteobacteria bacterium]